MIFSSGIRVLLITLLALLTQLPTTSVLTYGAVLAGLLVVAAVARQASTPQVMPSTPPPRLTRTGGERVPVLRQAVMAGPGRPQPRAPGARYCAAT